MSKVRLLDTNIIISLLKINLEPTIIIEQYPDSFICASFMTRVELLSAFGLTKKDEKQILDFFILVPIIPYNETIEHNAIIIRRNSHLKIPDAFIVATALFIKATLITNDKQIRNLKWPKLDVQSLSY
jgi:predicted nucleic acid-binding protein